MNKENGIPWDGHCKMLDGKDKVPMTASEARRKSIQMGLHHYKCRHCGMYHFSSKKSPVK